MTWADSARTYIVASAELGAVIETSRLACDLGHRQSPATIALQLRRRADELAASPIGRDQILRLALLAAAHDLERGDAPAPGGAEPPLEPDPTARRHVRKAVLAARPAELAEARRAVEHLERRHRPETRDRFDLAERLASEADLHDVLWDDPRLACTTWTRQIMRRSIALLLERAQRLAPDRRMGRTAIARRA
jgi:hypothetical protein